MAMTEEERKEGAKASRRRYYLANQDKLQKLSREYHARRRLEHPGAIEVERASCRRYCQGHRVILAKRTAIWRQKNPDKVKAMSVSWYAANHERKAASDAIRRQKNAEKLSRRYALWCKANPEKCVLHSAKHRALKYANTPLDEMLTSTEWLAILAEANGHCHYCGKEAKLTLDHVIPLSKGGKHSKDNVVPACGHCNYSKRDKTPEEWRAKVQREVVSA